MHLNLVFSCLCFQPHRREELHSAAQRGAWRCISALFPGMPVNWLAPSERRGREPASGPGAVSCIAGAWHHSARWGASSFALWYMAQGWAGCQRLWAVVGQLGFLQSETNTVINFMWSIQLILKMSSPVVCALLSPITSGKEAWLLWQWAALSVLHQFSPPSPPVWTFKWKWTRW